MIRWLAGLLLLANILFFAAIRWGEVLTTDVDALNAQAEISPDKIKLFNAAPPVSSPVVPAAPAVPEAVSAVTTFSPASILTPELVLSPKPVTQCMEWGEFSGGGLAQVQAALATLHLGEKLVPRSVEHASGFWVYISPLKNYAEVQRKIVQLKKLGVNDYFVVQEEGAWLNAISLGVFRTEESARKYLVGLQNKGVRSAKVGERMSKLRFTQFRLNGLDAATADKLRELKKDFPDSELKIAECN